MRPGLQKQGQESVKEVHLVSGLAVAFPANANTAEPGQVARGCWREGLVWFKWLHNFLGCCFYMNSTLIILMACKIIEGAAALRSVQRNCLLAQIKAAKQNCKKSLDDT